MDGERTDEFQALEPYDAVMEEDLSQGGPALSRRLTSSSSQHYCYDFKFSAPWFS